MPVVQDVIMASINCSRWLKSSYQRNSSGELVQVYDTFAHTKEETAMSFAILKKLFEKGADINCTDSYGNSCLQRAILDARQFLPRNADKNPRPINKELIEDFKRIFQLLFLEGANPNELHRSTGKTITEFYANEEVARFLIF